MVRTLRPVLLVLLAAVAGCSRPPPASPQAVVAHHPGPWDIDAPPASASVARPAVAQPTGLALVRDGSGQFHVDAQVNGQAASFLVDTGADTVAISEADAGRLGLVPDPDSFRPTVQTASGRAMAAEVIIDRLTVGSHDLDGVRAVVVQGLPINLLGQNVLRRLGKISLSGDRMTIEPD